jgi:hypothetical protein
MLGAGGLDAALEDLLGVVGELIEITSSPSCGESKPRAESVPISGLRFW